MPQLDPTSLHELEVLNHVEQSPSLSSRSCATKLGVSVKLAHEILRRMVERGLLHVDKENSRRWQYMLTPSGIAEKARLTVEFIEFSMHFYRQARRRSAQVCRDLAESGRTRIAFIGAGEFAEIVYLGVQEWQLSLTAVYDSDRADESFMGVPISPLSALAGDASQAIIICCYDRSRPLEPYLPASVDADARMEWVFARPGA
jgi:DNA-binding MarR family transcriptional regulator